jgi:hypothetical protein
MGNGARVAAKLVFRQVFLEANMTVSSLALIAQLNTTYGGVLGTAILIVQIAVIISVLAGAGSAGHKLLWTILILLLPVIGLILYWFLGRSAADRPLLE